MYDGFQRLRLAKDLQISTFGDLQICKIIEPIGNLAAGSLHALGSQHFLYPFAFDSQVALIDLRTPDTLAIVNLHEFDSVISAIPLNFLTLIGKIVAVAACPCVDNRMYPIALVIWIHLVTILR